MGASSEVKILSDNGRSLVIGGYGVVFGGADLVGDYFTKSTDFWFDRLTHSPMVLYQHGQDQTLKRTVVGRVVSKTEDDIGLWVEAQITAAKQYADAIRKLVAEGHLGWSSGSVPHLVQRVKGTRPGTAEITSWPIVELSLTPTPTEPRTIGVKELKTLLAADPSLKSVLLPTKAATSTAGSYEELQEDLEEAIAKALGVDEDWVETIATFSDHVIVCVCEPGDDDMAYWDFPYTTDAQNEPSLGSPKQLDQTFSPASKAVLDTAGRNALGAGDFAYIDSSGGRHLPVNDAAHVRAAMSRFNQTHFESPAKKKSAARKILSRARALGIDVADDSAVAMAAKGGVVPLTDLSDDAFAYVEPGGVKDDQGLTAPRSHRHFAHHAEDGSVDPEQLDEALEQTLKSEHGAHARAHLLRHRDALETKARDDAHTLFWSYQSLGGQLLVTSENLHELAYRVVDEEKAMATVQWQHPEERALPVTLQQLIEAKDLLEVMIAHAQQAETGDDGRARATYLRQELELLEV